MSDSPVAQMLSAIRGRTWPYVAAFEAKALLPWLATAIEKGDAWAMLVRGRIADGNLLPREPDLALEMWNRGDALGSVECTFELGREAERSGDRGQAIRHYEKAAAAGLAPAAMRRGQLALSVSFSETWRLSRSEIEALRADGERWFRRAVELGREDAWEDISFAVRCRRTNSPQEEEEVQRENELCLSRAAAADPTLRAERVLLRYLDASPSGVSSYEAPTVLPWLESASGRGDTWAMWFLAGLIDSGDAPGGKPLALSLWQRGADQGDARCQFELGFRVEKKKKKEARALYEQAAAAGLALAALRLGHLATTWKDAEKWYLLAAKVGRADAWLDMARLLTSGAKGAPIDLLEAARCWERAAEGGGMGPVGVAAEMFEEGVYAGHPIGRDAVKARRFAELGMNLSIGGGVPRCHYAMAKLMAAGEGGPVDLEGAALWSRIAARAPDHVKERAQVLSSELWSRLDEFARHRVIERDRELTGFDAAA